jgi:hypothetical protein
LLEYELKTKTISFSIFSLTSDKFIIKCIFVDSFLSFFFTLVVIYFYLLGFFFKHTRQVQAKVMTSLI